MQWGSSEDLPLFSDGLSFGHPELAVDRGGGAMPAKLVRGTDEADVLAYLSTIVGPGK